MPNSRPEILIDKLLSNTLSMDELQELLADLGQEEMDPRYSAILEKYFNRLINSKNGHRFPENNLFNDEV